MKPNKIVILIILGLTMGGCYPEARVIWSPDGELAAVLGDDGLHLCDPQGKLSELLIENAQQASWYPDSKELCVVSKEYIDNWADVDRILTDEQRKMVQAESDSLLQEILAFKGNWDKFEPSREYKAGLLPLWIYLREKHGKELKAKMTKDEWKKLQSRLPVYRIQKVYLEKNAPPRIQLILETFMEVQRFRISPNGSIIALILEEGKLFVLSPKGKLRPVASRTSFFPDWSPDGQKLVYCKSRSDNGDDVQLGSITSRRICNEDGTVLEKFGKPKEMAGVMFHETARVRCPAHRKLHSGIPVVGDQRHVRPLGTRKSGFQLGLLHGHLGSRRSVCRANISNAGRVAQPEKASPGQEIPCHACDRVVFDPER